MAIIITDQFRLRQKNFLDDRQGLATSLSTLKSWDFSQVPIPEGFEVYVGGVWYIYKSSYTDDPDTGKFRSINEEGGVNDHEVRIQKLEKESKQLFFEDGCDTAQTFSQLLTSTFWIDSTGENHAKAGRIVTVTSDGERNGPWYLTSSDYTSSSSWIKLISRGDLITTTSGGTPTDTNLYTAAKIDATFPKKISPENITAEWTFKENQVFEKELTANKIITPTGIIDNLEAQTSEIGIQHVTEELISTGTTTLKEVEIGTSGSIRDENGETVARVDRIIADYSELGDLDEQIRRRLGLIGVGNLLRNTSFAGQYESLNLENNSIVNSETVVYNSKYSNWNVTPGAVIVEDSRSITGYSMKLETSTSSASQETVMSLGAGTTYVLSWKQSGNVKVEVGNYELEIKIISETSSYKFCYAVIEPTITQKELIVFSGGEGYVFEIKFEEGIIPTTWFPCVLDTDPIANELYKFDYLRATLMDKPEGADLTVLNLYLKSQIKLGDIVDGQITDVYGGISGIVSDEADVMIWSGSSYEEAVGLMSRIVNDDSYLDTLTTSQLRGLTKTIISFNYKTVITDLYAVGKFKGKHLDENGNLLGSYPRLTATLPALPSGGGNVVNVGFTMGRLNKVEGSYPQSINFGGTVINFTAGLCSEPEGQYTINTGETIDGISSLHLIFHEGFLTKISSVKDYNTTYYWY